MALKQRQQQRVPDLGQWVGTLPATGLGGFGLEAACINPVGIAHRDANRCGSHLLAATGSSFGHVERNLLNGEWIRHDPVPCAWQPDSADPSGAVNQIGAPSQTYCCGTIGNPPECVPCHVDSNTVQLLTRTRQTSSFASRYNRDSLLGCIGNPLHQERLQYEVQLSPHAEIGLEALDLALVAYYWPDASILTLVLSNLLRLRGQIATSSGHEMLVS